MKKIFVSIIMACGIVTMSQIAFAQSNVIKLNILSPIVRTANFSFEHAINESSSIQLGFFYTGVSISDLKYRGIGITPEYRFFLSETPAPDGAYVAPFVRYMNINLESEDTGDKASLSAFGGGVVIGREWIFKKLISLDIFLGPAYYSSGVSVDSGSEDEFDISSGFSGFTLRFGVDLGIAF